jgi:lysophospholipid acyltransferase (LPLAT)-like uncharacterized protein
VTRALLGVLVGFLARAWLATLRVRVVAHPALEAWRDRPWVLAFWHGTQWPLLAWSRRRPTVVLVSLSRDGALQARALRVLGLRVVRGSSSRGGARGLAALVRAMKRDGLDAAFAVDGPRGPRGVVKRGAILAAGETGGVLVPMAGHVRRGLVLRRAWDHFAIAWPFTSVDVVLGAPIDPGAWRDPRAEVEAELRRLNEELAKGEGARTDILVRAPCPVWPRSADSSSHESASKRLGNLSTAVGDPRARAPS